MTRQALVSTELIMKSEKEVEIPISKVLEKLILLVHGEPLVMVKYVILIVVREDPNEFFFLHAPSFSYVMRLACEVKPLGS